MTPPDITVSIVSYNTRGLLRDCLRSLSEQERAGEVVLEVVVADNGSTDGSVEMVRAEFPAVTLVETGGNIGYGRANNAALASAQGRYVFILNSDTVVGPGALAALRDFLDAHPEASAAGAQLILPDGAIQPSCAADPTLRSVFWEQTYLYKLFPGSPVTGGYALTYWDYQSPRAVEQVCGACLMVRRPLYEQLGGFDPRYFMYFEDTDLCVRIRQTGAEIWFLPDAKIKHMLGGSSGRDWRLRARMIASYNKSRYYFFTRTEGRARGRLLKTIVLLGATLRVASWSLLALSGRAGVREQARIWRSVWRQTWRMTPAGDTPAQDDLGSGPQNPDAPHGGAMHIAIDARSIFTDGGGDRTFFRNVIQHMARLSPEDRWTLYADRSDPDRDSLRAQNVAVAPPLPATIGAFWNVTHLVPQLRRDRIDLLHAQYMLPPVGPVSCPMVVTIHDVTFRLFPSWFPRRDNRVQNLLIPQAARRAARVLTGSQSAAADIHRTMQIPQDRIVVTPYGLDERFKPAPPDEQDGVRERHGLPPSYLFGVGLLRLRKNVTVVLRAVSRLVAAGQWPPGCVLALTGGWGGAPEADAYRAAHPEIETAVRVLGYVPDADLPALYSGALLSVYPSLYEGFGFPALESMACGCPVVSSDTSSLPEVVGRAGLLLPPEDIEGWADALRRLLHDGAERERLRRAGLVHAATFGWERTARETLAVYRDVAGQNP